VIIIFYFYLDKIPSKFHSVSCVKVQYSRQNLLPTECGCGWNRFDFQTCSFLLQ